ncbi:MAG: aminotransferase class III-fold pyridoxal phosphate-dependent enzyme, partial [Tepidisphaeraceae bacterium]
MDGQATDDPILAAYLARTPRSRGLFARAERVLPTGVTHDIRALSPYPVYLERAQGSRKWDVDGNEYVDYFGGHGALLLGHAHPAVVEAVRKQVERGTHYGGSHELELMWAEQVCRMVPCARKVRFTASGTEATLLAIRIARAFTGRKKIVRLLGHFHGWHDQVAFAVTGHYDGAAPPGVLPELVQNAVCCTPNDLESVARALDQHAKDVACLIMEPTG